MLLTNKTTGVSVGAINLPGKKRRCLVIQEGNAIRKYATFDTDLDASTFMMKLAEWVNAKEAAYEDLHG